MERKLLWRKGKTMKTTHVMRRTAAPAAALLWMAASGLARAESVMADPNPLTILPRHSADIGGDAFAVDSNEFNVVLQYWRSGGYGVDLAEPDGYLASGTHTNGVRHSADHDETPWILDDEEILRGLAIRRAETYRYTAAAPGGFAPVPTGAAYTPPDPASVSGTVRYVSAASTNPVAPYTSPATAAATIQTAVDLSSDGDLILVDAGLYASGVRSNAYGNNRLVITNGVIVASLHGPEQTILVGSATGFVRGVFLHHRQAELHGFGIRNGVADGNSGTLAARDGGGLLALGARLIRHCIIENSSATPWGSGGGAYLASISGRVERITIRNCQATAGGGLACFWGQKLFLEGLVLVSNTAVNGGGMIADNSPRISNILALYNHASQRGGAFQLGTFAGLWYATVAENTAGLGGGGAYFQGLSSSIANAIFHQNGTNPIAAASSSNAIFDVCMGPYTNLPVTANRIHAQTPAFLDPGQGNYRLPFGTPLADIGNEASWMTNMVDLDGAARIVGDAPDLGAYEVTPLTATALPAYYIPGSNLAVTIEVRFPQNRTPLTLGMALVLPNGWSLVSIDGPGAPETTGDGYVFTGELAPVMTLTATVYAAQSATGTASIAAEILWMADGMIDLASGGLTPSPHPVPPMYPVDLAYTGQGSLSLAPGWYPVGSTVTVTAVADPGWRFVRWTGDTHLAAIQDNTLELVIPDGPVTLGAEFIVLRQLTILTPYGSTTPSVGTQQVDDGTPITVIMTTPSVTMGGTQFVCTGWAGLGSAPALGSGLTASFTIAEDSQVEWLWSAFEAGHASRGYRAAGIHKALVECRVQYDPSTTITQIWWKPQLPAGSSVISVTGDGNPALDGDTILIRENLTSGNLQFSYEAALPDILTGPVTVGGDSGVNEPQ